MQYHEKNDSFGVQNDSCYPMRKMTHLVVQKLFMLSHEKNDSFGRTKITGVTITNIINNLQVQLF